MEQLLRVWRYTHLSPEELQQGLTLAAAHHHPDTAQSRWKSWALTEIVYRDHDPLSKAFAIASFLPLVIVMFLSGLASAPSRERRIPALNLLVYLIVSVVWNVTCKALLRSARPAHPAAGMNYTTLHGMPSDHAQFMAGLAVYLARRWSASGPSPSIFARKGKTRPKTKNGATGGATAPMPMPRLLSAFHFSAAVFVGVGRVYNGYHTVGQVIVGWAMGCVLALLCTTAYAQAVLSLISQRIMLPVMLLCTYWTEAVC